MRLTASAFYNLYQPSVCELRPYLMAQDVAPAAPGPFQELLLALGQRHEEAHRASLGNVLDLSAGDLADREHRTGEAIRSGYPILYQPVFRARETLNGAAVEIIGEPDFLIRQANGYAIRDCKIARRITDKDHPEILRQVGLYGWLYEQNHGSPPAALEVLAGDGAIVPVNYDGGVAAKADLAKILALSRAREVPFVAVGWTKCSSCGFRDRCWNAAIEGRNVAVVPDVDQALTRVFYDMGVRTYDDLLATFPAPAALAEVKKPFGATQRKVGKAADSILRNARALATGRAELIAPPVLPAGPNYVMFDLEGLPPPLDAIDKIYLWGMQVFGERPSPYRPALAEFGEAGDRAGWDAFLATAEEIIRDYGELPFVHWATYEKTKLAMYVERYGDRDGIAERVGRNLFDLLPATRQSVALPLPSYSLKVVEQYVGFKRSQDEYGGEWSMARYIEATETADEALRQKVIADICTYNREDLEATWAVFNWLQAKR